MSGLDNLAGLVYDLCMRSTRENKVDGIDSYFEHKFNTIGG